MIFEPYIELKDGDKISVIIRMMQQSDAERTKKKPVWQTDWTSEYIETSLYEKYAVETEAEAPGVRQLTGARLPSVSIRISLTVY